MHRHRQRRIEQGRDPATMRGAHDVAEGPGRIALEDGAATADLDRMDARGMGELRRRQFARADGGEDALARPVGDLGQRQRPRRRQPAFAGLELFTPYGHWIVST